MYQIKMQFIPGYNNIWVVQLNPEDTIWNFEIESDAIAKAEELQASDKSGRIYEVYIPVAEEVPTEEIFTEEIIEEVPTEEEIVEEVSTEEIVPIEEVSTEEIPAE